MIPLGIANSSPLISLDRIGRLDLLSSMFVRLITPEEVAQEVGDLPTFVTVERLSKPPLLRAFPPRIHTGEAAVILLGFEYPEAVLVLDDWYAREFAASRGLRMIGTIGLLLRAKAEGHIPEVSPIFSMLQEAGFRISPRVLSEALLLAGETP